MFIDRAKIYIKAGDGGNGNVSFYTEKYISNGGPDGGDGGKGGDVIFVAEGRKSSLMDFQFAQKFKAGDGEKGGTRFCNGKNGKDLIIEVPPGTIVRDAETGNMIADLFSDGDKVTVLHGGFGGKGNARFKSSRRQAPHFAQEGEKAEQKCVTLELKTIADVGLVGYPNVGKSTLLSCLSAARPKIANYPFTTLSPNLGVVKYYDGTFVVADIPGLIDGAGSGAGLGTEFLRHIDRVRLIVHVIDISGSEGRDPIEDYENINKELKTYSQRLSKLPQIVALNKCDLVNDSKAADEFKKKIKTQVVEISGATQSGIDALKDAIYKKLTELPPLAAEEFEPFVYEKKDITKYDITRCDDGAFEISGGMMDHLARNVTLDNYDSFMYFQKKLKDEGVIKKLRKAGAKDGDIIRILDIEFEYYE